MQWTWDDLGLGKGLSADLLTDSTRGGRWLEMSHCSRTLPSPQHPNQLIPFPKKATNIYGMTSLAFQTQRVPCASLQQCKASLRHNQPARAGSSNEKIRFRSLWIKTHCVGKLFFLGSSVALPTLLQSLSSDAWGQGWLNSSLLNFEGQRCLTSSWKYQWKTKCPYGQSRPGILHHQIF